MGAENYKLLNSLPLENCILLGYYAQSTGNSIRTFRDNVSFPSSEVKFPYSSRLQGTSFPLNDRSPRNVGKELPPHAA